MHDVQLEPWVAHCVLQLDWMQPRAVMSGPEAFGHDWVKHCWMHWLKSVPCAPASSSGGQAERQLSESMHEVVPVPNVSPLSHCSSDADIAG